MEFSLKKFEKNEFGKLIMPNKILKFNYKTELQKLIEKLYFDNINYSIITNIFAISIILSIIEFIFAYDYIYSFFNDYFYNLITKFIIIFCSITIINFITFYFLLFIYFFLHESKFRKNEKEIEEDLPEFLDNLVSNIKGGIPIEKALLKSVRPEQKALKAEVTLINQKIMMGKTIYQTLHEFRLRFDSPILNRTIFLIEEGIKNGGNIAQPLERVSINLKKIYNLDAEIRANSGGFTTVIKAITLFVGPLLFGLALTLLTFIGKLFGLMINSGINNSSYYSMSVTEIPSEFSTYLVYFSYAMIILITFFSSLITAELKNEKIYESMKYLPIYIAIGIIIFKIISTMLLSFFGNIL